MPACVAHHERDFLERFDFLDSNRGRGKSARCPSGPHAPECAQAGRTPNDKNSEGIRIEQRIPLVDNIISHGGQYVAMVVADSFENEEERGPTPEIAYAEEKPVLTKADALGSAKSPEKNNGEEIQVKKRRA